MYLIFGVVGNSSRLIYILEKKKNKSESLFKIQN